MLDNSKSDRTIGGQENGRVVENCDDPDRLCTGFDGRVGVGSQLDALRAAGCDRMSSRIEPRARRLIAPVWLKLSTSCGKATFSSPGNSTVSRALSHLIETVNLLEQKNVGPQSLTEAVDRDAGRTSDLPRVQRPRPIRARPTQEDSGDLPALAGAGAVAEKTAAAELSGGGVTTS
jgi:hypothetical protein